jgi:hypothetical protein
MPKTRQVGVRRQITYRRMRMAFSSARIEGHEVTDATKFLMMVYADGNISIKEAVNSIIASYTSRD